MSSNFLPRAQVGLKDGHAIFQLGECFLRTPVQAEDLSELALRWHAFDPVGWDYLLPELTSRLEWGSEQLFSQLHRVGRYSKVVYCRLNEEGRLIAAIDHFEGYRFTYLKDFPLRAEAEWVVPFRLLDEVEQLRLWGERKVVEVRWSDEWLVFGLTEGAFCGGRLGGPWKPVTLPPPGDWGITLAFSRKKLLEATQSSVGEQYIRLVSQPDCFLKLVGKWEAVEVPARVVEFGHPEDLKIPRTPLVQAVGVEGLRVPELELRTYHLPGSAKVYLWLMGKEGDREEGAVLAGEVA